MKIIDSDKFKDMSLTAQALYFHLVMNADDEGFLGNARSVQRSICASADDLQILIDNEYIIRFESGVVCIRHWKVQNNIQPSRMKDTQYIDEKSMVELRENNEYMLASMNADKMSTECQQNVAECCHSVDLGKVSIDIGACSVEESVRGDEISRDTSAHTQPEIIYNSLCDQYGKSFVDERIERSKKYKNSSSMDIIAKWCAEDYARGVRGPTANRSKVKKNQFNDFPQRNYDYDAMEKVLNDQLMKETM